MAGRPGGAADGGARRGYITVLRGLSGLQLFAMENFDTGRCSEDLAELVHPVMGVFRAADTPMAKLIELIEVRELDFELQGRTTRVTSGQWNQHAPVETAVASRLKLLSDKVQGLLSVGRPHIV